MMKNVFKGKNTYLYVSLFVFILFAGIAYATPLQGDDWGYALNGRSGNPLALSFQFYQSWSGRFFSELWGFLVAPQRGVWIFANALFFAGIYFGLYRLGRIRRHPTLVALLLLAGMLSVDDHLRMETYTWIMGTTYVIPLLISVFYFCVADALFQEDFPSTRLHVLAYGVNIPLFIAGLMMENISASLLLACAVLLVYAHFNKPRLRKYFVLHFLVMLFSFTLLRCSPGAGARLLRDSAEWASLSLFEQICRSYPTFIEMTFVRNDYAVGLFAICLGALVLFHKKKIPLLWRLFLFAMQGIAFITVFSFLAVGPESFLLQGSSLYSMLFWPFYVVSCFGAICLLFEEEHYRRKTLFILAFAGINSAVMMASPIYGSRSTIYTVFYLLEAAMLILDNMVVSKKLLVVFLLVFLGIIADRSLEYFQKYRAVYYAEKERQEILTYYRQHPEDVEAWIPRFPIYTTHASDIEPHDRYHLETFKEYYNLPQAADKIVFYFKESPR